MRSHGSLFLIGWRFDIEWREEKIAICGNGSFPKWARKDKLA
jgi:hypothetical protein